MGSQLNAISASPDQQSFVCGGRSVYKILKWDAGWKEVTNLRTGKNNLNYTVNDVQWNPIEYCSIASAPTNGALVFWDPERNQTRKMLYAIKEHERTINKLAWHPAHPKVILSASKDGTVKLWDTRIWDPRKTDNGSSLTFDGKKEDSINDVQFDPHNHNQFIVGSDGGNIGFWDVRNSSKVEFVHNSAHSDDIFCARWHPRFKNIIATGGRDSYLKIWELQGTTLKPVVAIQTVSAVWSILWRPTRPYQIVSAGNFAYALNIWDIRRPHFPIGSISAHKNCQGIAWMYGHRHIASCGLDSLVLRSDLHSSSDVYLPYKQLSSTSVAWSPTDEISLVFESINRSIAPANQETEPTAGIIQNDKESIPKTIEPIFKYDPQKRERSFTSISNPNDPVMEESFSYTTCSYLAKNYKFSGVSVNELCVHNAEVARKVRMFKVAQLWEVLRIFFGESEEVEESVVVDSAAKEVPRSPIVIKGPLPDEKNEDMLAPDLPIRSFPLVPGDQKMVLDDCELQDDIVPGTREMEEDIKDEADEYVAMHGSRDINAKTEEERISPFFSDVFNPTAFKLPISLLLSALVHHIEEGDMVTPATVYLALSEKISESPTSTPHRRFVENVPLNEQAVVWIHNYVELLYKLQFFTVAAEVIKSSKLNLIKEKSLRSTSLLLSCSGCSRQLEAGGWYCYKCKAYKLCDICNLPVKGNYVWCQGCGHGGHREHLESWFQANTKCPTGCSHICNLTPTPENTKTTNLPILN
uniref:ZZ-type domain-containing protein n=1 Tax=Arcella intermedia TaxID=1963864 RepID=A0A6B2KYL6_9EUKA